MQHPLFMVTKQDVVLLRERMAQSEVLKARYERIAAQKEACLKEEFLSEAYANSVYSQHGNYYEIGAQLHRLANVLGVVYAVEGDFTRLSVFATPCCTWPRLRCGRGRRTRTATCPGCLI